MVNLKTSEEGGGERVIYYQNYTLSSYIPQGDIEGKCSNH